MIALYRRAKNGRYEDIAFPTGVGQFPTRDTLGFGCLFLDINLDGALDLLDCQRPYRRHSAQTSAAALLMPSRRNFS